MNRRLIVPTVALLCLLGGCSTATPDETPTTPAEQTAPAESPSAEALPQPTEPAVDSPTTPSLAPVGCDLVTPDLVRQFLHVEPGTCEAITSWADGPAGLYPAITMAIDTTASAPTIMPREVCGGGGIEGALPIPGADYGYATEGDLCVVKGTVGVKTSALLDPGVATAEDWQALALALLPLL